MPNERRPHALILSGAGRYADPWHPFAETSALIGEILGAAGFDTEISEQTDARLAALADHRHSETGGGVDLLVVNLGRPAGPEPTADAAARAGLLAYVAGGGPVLSMHVSATSLPGVPEWEEIMGGTWLRGTTMHPPLADAHVRVWPERHPIVAGLHDFELEDELYSFLRVSATVTVLAAHELDGVEHPLIWVRQSGASRTVYDALGHDARSFASSEHRALLARAARWLVAAGSEPCAPGESAHV